MKKQFTTCSICGITCKRTVHMMSLWSKLSKRLKMPSLGSYESMSKTKDKTRPRYECPRCRIIWVADQRPYCMGCGKAGVPLNSGAEKTVKKLNKEE